jgi:hypothetical protein
MSHQYYDPTLLPATAVQASRPDISLVLFREKGAAGLIFLRATGHRSTWVSGEVSVSGEKLSCTPRPFALVGVVAHNGALSLRPKDPLLRGLSV